MFIQKRTIAIFAVLGTVLSVLTFILFPLSLVMFSRSPKSNMSLSFLWIGLAYLAAFIAPVLNIIAHVGAAARQARLRQWVWFACTLVIGFVLSFFPIVILIYLVVVPDVSQPELQNYHRFPPVAQPIPPQQYPYMLPQQYPPQQYQPLPPQQYQPVPPQQYQPLPPQQYQPVPPQKEEEEEEEEEF